MSEAAADIIAWHMGLQTRILETPEFNRLTAVLRLPVEDLDELEPGANMHAMAIEMIAHMIDDHSTDAVVEAVDAYVRSDLGVANAPAAEAPETSDAAATLVERGLATLPPPPAEIVSAMRAHFESLEPAGTGTLAGYSREGVLDCPGLAEVALDPLAVAVAERYMGTAPTLVEAAATRYSARSGGKPDFFQVDLGDYRLCRVLIHLTDVAEGAGLAFVEPTHQRKWIDMVRHGWLSGTTDFDTWYFERYRKSDEEVLRMFHRDPGPVAGPAGTRLMFDPLGVHKYVRPGEGEHLVLSLTYGVSPTPAATAPPAKTRVESLEPPYDYVGRLFFTMD